MAHVRGLAVVAGCSMACSGNPIPSGVADASSSDGSPVPNQALSFDGMRDFVTTGTAGFPTAGQPQTISLWLRYSSAAGTQTVVVLRTDNVSGVALGFRYGTIAVWSVFSSKIFVQAPAPPSPDTWHHVAYVFDGGFSTLYIDGTTAAVSSSGQDNRTPSSCWIGSWNGLTQFYAGAIDELRIWRVARSASEIGQEMAGQVDSNSTGLVAYFSCDSVIGTRLPDNSGNGNDGTLGAGDPRFMPTLIPSTVP